MLAGGAAAHQGGGRLSLLFFGVSIAYATAFAALLVAHLWLWNARGELVSLDFNEVYAAGTMAKAGEAARAYDWPAHRQAQAAVLGHPVTWKDYLGWHYPPPFLLAAVALTALPYVAAFLVWGLATLLAYLLVMRRIIGRAEAWLAALAFPSTFFNFAVGQNGFVSAALMGGTLSLLQTRPVVAGVLLGLLTYKPQLGLLFPFALAAGGHWRALLSATVTAIALFLASSAAFGIAAWQAFFHSITHTVSAVLMQGMAGWGKLNSLYGLCRWIGASAGMAGTVQVAAALALIGSMIWLWRSRAGFNLKAAGLVTASLVATPYLYVYDFAVLVVALGFLFRDRPFDAVECRLSAIGVLALAAFPLVTAPTGLVTLALTAAMVVRRVVRDAH